jgi:hypothetical protein
MFARTKVLGVALYLVGALVVVLTAHVMFRVYRRSPPWAILPDPATMPKSATSGSPGDVHFKYSPMLLARARHQLNQLQQTLEKTSAELKNRTQVLNQTRAEYRSLQAELDQTLTWVFELIADEAGLSQDADSPARQDQAASARAELETELEKLRSELSKTELLEHEQSQQVEDLKSELTRTELDIAFLQTQSEQQIGTLLEEKVAIESAATQALIQLGATAVPPLVGLLDDDRENVRSWSAAVLGKIGRDAKEAAPALKNLLNDPVERVRTQAKQALAVVESTSEK